jgi:hypothetical protein
MSSPALGANVLAHVAAVWIFELCPVPAGTVPRPEVPPTSVTFVQESVPQPPLLETARRRTTDESKKIAVAAPRMRDHAETTVGITDWESEARSAAADTMGRLTEAGAERLLSHRVPTPGTPDAQGVFGSEEENRRSGMVRDGEFFWVTDECYFDLPRGAQTPPPGREPRLPTRTCKPPPTGGGARMFDTLTPDYLKVLPARQ